MNDESYQQGQADLMKEIDKVIEKTIKKESFQTLKMGMQILDIEIHNVLQK